MDRHKVALWFVVGIVFLAGCAPYGKLRRELARVLQDLPQMPDSVLSSEVWDGGGGSDERCDGYLVSRLYATDQPIEVIVKFFEEEMLAKSGWSHDPRLPVQEDKHAVSLMNMKDGYLGGVERVDNLESLRANPFFLHQEVTVERPYKTIYQLTLVHIDSRYADYCWR